MARMAQRRSPPSSQGAPSSAPPSSNSGGIQIPHFNTDPVWSLCPWPLDVELPNGKFFTLPPLPAADWLQYMLQKEPDMSALVSDLMPELEDYFFDPDNGDVDLLEFRDLLRDVIGTVGARPWWITLRLISLAVANWDLIGPKLRIYDANPQEISLAAWLDLVLLVVMEHTDPQHITMLTSQLEIPPPEVMAEEPELLETMVSDQSAFLAMAGD